MLKNRISYTIIIIISAVSAFLLGVGFVLLYALVVLITASFLLARFAPYFARINESIDKTEAHKNEGILYRAAVPNKARFIYPRIWYSYFGAGQVVYDETRQGEFVLSFPYRGRYPVGVGKLYVTDCLGLFSPGFARKDPIYVTIFPRRIEDFALPPMNELFSGSASGADLRIEHSQDRFDVRKYTYGDDYRKIHWKLTAKKNELIIKDFNASVLNKTLIFADMAAIEAESVLKAEDDITSLAVSAAYYCLQNKMPAQVFISEDCIDIRTEADYEILLRLMAEAVFESEGYLADFLRIYSDSDNLYNIAIIVYTLSGALFEQISELSLLGHNIMLYTLDTQAKDEPDRFAALAATGVYCKNAAELFTDYE